MNTAVNKAQVRVYASGGCGMNIGAQLEQFRLTDEPGFAQLTITYIDTSRSNLRPGIKDQDCYFLENLDGSGKIRSENHEAITDQVRAVLQQFKPLDLNIVLHSTAGGSGSVIGPLIASELIASHQQVIVIGVGSKDTRIDMENTLKTIKSYEAISRLRKVPVVASYYQNSDTRTRMDVDQLIKNTVISLCILYSKSNLELDSKDLTNWLRFDKVTSFPSQLASLTIVDNVSPLQEVGSVITAATLATIGIDVKVRTSDDKPVPTEYQCVGYLPATIAETVTQKKLIHFIVSDGIFPEVVKDLTKELANWEQVQNARIKKATILSKDDQPISSGLVL